MPRSWTITLYTHRLVATERAFIRAHAVRWIAHEPQPGLVEVEFSDAADQRCRFVDKAPIFDSTGTLGPSSPLPS
jgi:hypothetical protein